MSRRTAGAENEKGQSRIMDGPAMPAMIPGQQSAGSPSVPPHVIIKLLGFTAAMVVAPIGTYFLTLNSLYKGNSTWAGATAAVMANVILIAYVIVAFQEDEGERVKEKAKKSH